MGEKTFKTFPKPLPDRLNVVFTLEKNPPKMENVKWVSGEPEKVLEELERDGIQICYSRRRSVSELAIFAKEID